VESMVEMLDLVPTILEFLGAPPMPGTQGKSLVPLKLYFKAGKAKIVLALAKGKREYDKRQSIRDREQRREMDRARKQR